MNPAVKYLSSFYLVSMFSFHLNSSIDVLLDTLRCYRQITSKKISFLIIAHGLS